ncbi:hypothetical protein NVP1193O_003 [Vibrio phage 1.193.O._10N.286.52.C6]|nr:hypothetical protein NVP1193O_003 [Vibrio phage 1.193.O._10N.286.52.C6]
MPTYSQYIEGYRKVVTTDLCIGSIHYTYHYFIRLPEEPWMSKWKYTKSNAKRVIEHKRRVARVFARME